MLKTLPRNVFHLVEQMNGQIQLHYDVLLFVLMAIMLMTQLDKIYVHPTVQIPQVVIGSEITPRKGVFQYVHPVIEHLEI